METEENYSGGVYLDHQNPSVVYTSRPINNVFEIEKWTFVGGKDKWKTEAVTRDSERDNIRPFVVRNYSGDQPNLLWAYNYKYPGFKSYESAIRVNQKAKGFDSGLNKEAIKTVAAKVADWQLRDDKTSPFSSGAVSYTHLETDEAVSDAKIVVGEGFTHGVTDQNGEYKLKAKPTDFITISKPGFEKVVTSMPLLNNDPSVVLKHSLLYRLSLRHI